MSHPRLSRTLLTFLFASVLVGLLSIGAGLLIGHVEIDEAVAIECTAFSLELQRQSSSQIWLTAPADRAALLEMDFLDLDGGIIQPHQVELAAGATTMVELPPGRPVSGIQLLASAPIQVEATLIRAGSVGPPERQPVSCKPTTPRDLSGGPETFDDPFSLDSGRAPSGMMRKSFAPE